MQSSRDVSLSYMALAFPVTKWWGGSFGIRPYSKSNYEITYKKFDPSTDSVKYITRASGGINQIYVGSGFSLLNIDQTKADTVLRTVSKTSYIINDSIIMLPDSITPAWLKRNKYLYQGQIVEIAVTQSKELVNIDRAKYHNISIGANVHYSFGVLKTIDYALFDNSGSNAFFNTRSTNNLTVNNITWDAGIQYTTIVTEAVAVTIGGSGQISQELQGEQHARLETFRGNTIPVPGVNIRDTVGPFVTRSIGYTPSTFQVGMMFKKDNAWKVGTDVRWENWSKYRTPTGQKDDNLTNSYTFSLGGEIIPDIDRKGWRSFAYRLGSRMGTKHFVLNAKQVDNFGITIGMGIPKRTILIVNDIKQKYTFYPFNIALEFGRSGSIKDNLIRNTYFKSTIGLSLNDKWFNKRKIE